MSTSMTTEELKAIGYRLTPDTDVHGRRIAERIPNVPKVDLKNEDKPVPRYRKTTDGSRQIVY